MVVKKNTRKPSISSQPSGDAMSERKTLKLILYKEDMTDEEWDKIDDFLGDLGISADVFEVDSRNNKYVLGSKAHLRM